MTAVYKTPAGGEIVRARYEELLARWPVPHTRHHIATSQGETHVTACGPTEAPPVILLHGSAFNSIGWMGDVALWARHFRLYAVDVIGEPNLSAPSRPPLDSDAHATWLRDVMAGLGIERAAFVGISLGGWLLLDFATRHPDRVTALVALCPAGIGRHKNVLLWALPMMLLGPWGIAKLNRMILGPAAAAMATSEAGALIAGFNQLIFKHFRVRTARMPIFGDEGLRQLTMPVLAILGAKDVMVDSPGIRERLSTLVPSAEMTWLPDHGHMIVGQTERIDEFLRQALRT